VKPHPDRSVAAWLAAVDEDLVFISVVSLAELRYGIERMTPGTRRNRLPSPRSCRPRGDVAASKQ
jgi:toxin FitB